MTIYVLVTDPQAHALPSKGFALDLGDGLVARTQGYTGPVNCTDPVTGDSTCDNYAYAAGDMAVNNRGMVDVDAYAPFPNAILMNCEWDWHPRTATEVESSTGCAVVLA